jgi:hypothetical protein
VRSLEAEVRELKDLLDEKDEKIDMLSRIRTHKSISFSSAKRPSVAAISPPSVIDVTEACNSDDEETFKVVQSPTLVENCPQNSFYMGTSSIRPLICK